MSKKPSAKVESKSMKLASVGSLGLDAVADLIRLISNDKKMSYFDRVDMLRQLAETALHLRNL